jgi:DNA-binding CsgD family transcriptional regulator
MSMLDAERPPKVDLIVTLVLLAVVSGGVTDIILDAPQGLWTFHVALEAGLVIVSLGSALYLGRGWYRAQFVLERVRSDMVVQEADRDAWRARAKTLLEGLGAAINERLEAWKLTPVERQTAILLLKGYSHKQIAHSARRSERTVRQHAVAVYRKSGLHGRAELAAFFLDGLLESD